MEQSKQKNLTKSDAVEGSEVRYLDANSMTSAGVLVGWSSDQTMNSQVSTGRLVIKNSATEIDLEATEECNILSAASTSFREKVNERVREILNRPPGDELEEFEKAFSHLVNMHDFDDVRSYLSWNRLLRESALRRKYGSETKCAEFVRCDSKIDSRTKIGDIGSVRIELEKFYMGDAVPGARRRGDQAHEGKSSRILRLCVVPWEDARVPIL